MNFQPSRDGPPPRVLIRATPGDRRSTVTWDRTAHAGEDGADLQEASALAEVLQRLDRGQPDPERVRAWGQLVEWIRVTHLGRLVARIRRRGGAGVDQDAVLHQLFVDLYDTPPRSPDSLRLEFRVRNALRQVREEEGSRRPGRVSFHRLPEGVGNQALELAGQEAAPTPQEALEAREEEGEWRARRLRLEEALASLPEGRVQRIARLRYLEGRKLGEIATCLGVPLGTVKSDLNRNVKPVLRQREREERWRPLEPEDGRRRS